MSKLITQDIISAVDWLKNAPPSWKERAYSDLKNKLGRVKTPMNIEAQKGIDLESRLNRAVNQKEYLNPDFKCSEKFRILIDKVIGYDQQKKTKTYLTIDHIEYCLYGKIDYYKENHIIDLKTTGEWKGENKYLSTYQHKIYCYNEKINKFTYLVCVFENKESLKIKDIHEVEYLMPESFDDLRIGIEQKIKEVVNFLSMDSELFNLYNTVYSMY
jgi:hypothetical protein